MHADKMGTCICVSIESVLFCASVCVCVRVCVPVFDLGVENCVVQNDLFMHAGPSLIASRCIGPPTRLCIFPWAGFCFRLPGFFFVFVFSITSWVSANKN